MALEEEKNIRALRTFTDDANRVKSASTATTHTELVLPKVEETPIPEKGTKKPSPMLDRIAVEAEKISSSTQESYLSQRSGTLDGSEDGGQIIRETRHKRFRLLPAILEASTAWVKGKKTEYDDYRHPYYPVANADARTEVIKAAVGKSAIAPQEDFKEVAERLKEVERKPVTTSITIKDKAELPKPSWSHIENEEGEAVPQTVIPKEPIPEPTAVPMPVAVPPLIAEQLAEPEPQVIVEKKEEVVPIPVVPQQAPEIVEEIEVETIPTPGVAEQNVMIAEPTVVEDTPLSEPVAEKAVYQAPAPAPRYAPSERREERAGWGRYVPITVILLASVLGVSASFYIFKKDDAPQQKATVYEVPALMEAQSLSFPLPADRESLLGALMDTLSSNGIVMEFYARIDDAGGGRPASAEEVLFVLAPKISGSFNRAIEEISFGGAATEPFIVMKITSYDIAFAGMLEWERTMSADLSPLYGNPVITSFDPSARTDTQVRDAFFKDTIASNKNVRLLLDEEGTDRIVYTFVDQNTILITTTREVLDDLLPLVK